MFWRRWLNATSVRSLPARHWLAIAIAVATLFALEFAGVNDLLRYQRSAIAAGQWWRLLTGHFVHLGLSHVVLDSAGLVMVMVLVGDRLRVREWAALLPYSALAISAGLWFAAPGIHWYVGISGVLHTLMTAGALALWTDRPRESPLAATILVLLVAKLVYEHFYGPLPGSEMSSGGTVVVEAHVYGAIAGTLWAALRWLWHSLRSDDGRGAATVCRSRQARRPPT